jgi:hypothetical protein
MSDERRGMDQAMSEDLPVLEPPYYEVRFGSLYFIDEKNQEKLVLTGSEERLMLLAKAMNLRVREKRTPPH